MGIKALAKAGALYVFNCKHFVALVNVVFTFRACAYSSVGIKKRTVFESVQHIVAVTLNIKCIRIGLDIFY